MPFAEAQTVFYDDNARIMDDPDHSGNEERFLILGMSKMRNEYDFSKSRRNPYAKILKRQITIRLDEPTIGYFRQMATKIGLPYQSLMNLYLRDCAEHRRALRMHWPPNNG